MRAAILTELNKDLEVRDDVELRQQGRLDLERMITKRIDLADINKAFDDMTNGRVIRSVISY